MPNLIHRRRLSPDVLDLLRHYVRKSRADNTRRSYASQWGTFDRWCSGQGCRSLPAEPISVAAYLAQRAGDNAALATINVSLAAITFAHKVAGLPFDRAHPDLALVLAGIRRVHARPTRQAEPLGASLCATSLRRCNPRQPGCAMARCSRSCTAPPCAAPKPPRSIGCRPAADAAGLPSRQGMQRSSCSAARRRPARSSVCSYRRVPALSPCAPSSAGCAMPAFGQANRCCGHSPGADRFAASACTPTASAASCSVSCWRISSTMGWRATRRSTQARRYTGHSGRVGFCVTATEAGVPAQHMQQSCGIAGWR